MVQSSRVPFISELHQGIISLLCMKNLEKVIMAQWKSLLSIKKNVPLCPVNMLSVHVFAYSIYCIT